VLVAVRCGPEGSPEEPALEVLTAMLHAQGGRLFLALREQRSLAYDVWCDLHTSLDGGVFTVGLEAAPERAEEALEAMEAEIAALGSAPPGEAEVARYVRMARGRAAAVFERAAGRAADVARGERLGVPWGLDAARARVAGVTVEAVAEAVAGLLAGPRVVVVVGPR
jgi:zinc protease